MALPAAAQGLQGPSGLYLGLAAGADGRDVRFHKRIFSAENYAAGGPGTGDANHAQATGAAVGMFAGYRWPLSDRLFVDAEAEAVRYSGKSKGHLDGTGRQPTDTWPSDWSVAGGYGYGLVVRFGGALRGRNGLALYGLAGVRDIRTTFRIAESGCPDLTVACPPYVHSQAKNKRDLAGWTLGIGVEKRMSKSFLLQVQLQHTKFRQDAWRRLYDDGAIIIPSALTGRETGLSLRFAYGI